MQGFLLRNIQRQLQRLALGATLGMVVVTTISVVSGQLEPAIGEAGRAAGTSPLGTGDGCDTRAETTSAARQGDVRERPGAAVSCAAGDQDLGDQGRRAGKPADRVIPKQRN